jgi:general stress protein 26
MSEHLDRAELEVRLWHEIDKSRFGMLGLAGGRPRHMQPMTAYADKAEGALWFFTKRTSDLVRETGVEGHAAMFCIMAKDQEFQACVGGDLAEDRDRAKIDRYWNAVAAAWFPEGKDDPDLTLLKFVPADAQVWVSRSGPLTFAWEIAKANATKTEPDVGEVAHLNLN